MTWTTQICWLAIALTIVAIFAIIARLVIKRDLGRFWPHAKEADDDPPEELSQRPVMRGFLEAIFVYPLYWISLLTLNNAFRRNRSVHAWIVDAYVVGMTGAAFYFALDSWGRVVWVFAIWRILCSLVQVLSVGIFRGPIRKMRGDLPPPSNPRIVLLALVNWVDLVVLYAILYQALNPARQWVYNSFTTQATLNHAAVLSPNAPPLMREFERAVVASQISMSLLTLATLIGMYVGIVATNLTVSPKSSAGKTESTTK